MMKNKTVVIILSVSLLLFIYIYFVDGRFMSTDEKKSRAENVFGTLRADQIDTIALETPKGKLTLKATKASPGTEAVWHITAPKSFVADDTEVQSLVSAMDFLIYSRVVEDNLHDKRFGLNTPRIKGTAGFGENSVSFAIGADTPDGDGVYISVDSDKDRFYVVSTDFLSAMNKGLNDLRDRHLLNLDTAEIEKLAVHSDSRDWEAYRNADTGDWQVSHAGRKVPGAASELKQLAAAAAGLEISQFVADTPRESQKYGFTTAPPSLSLTSSDSRQITIELGAPCDENSVYVRIKGQPAIHCVSAHFQSLLTRPVSRYFEKRLLPVSPQDIALIRITKGEEKMELTIDEGLWHVSGLKTEETSQTAFSELFDELKQVRATDILFAPDSKRNMAESPDTDKAAALPAHTEIPLLSAELETVDSQILTLLFFTDPTTPNGVLLKRGNAEGWLPLPKKVIDLLEPYPFRFRQKVVTQCQPDDATAIDIASGGVRQTLKKNNDEWLIVTPIAAGSDAASVKKLLTLACETPVTGYPRVTENPFKKDNLFATVTVSFTRHTQEGKTQDNTQTGKATIEIGEVSNAGSRFARVASQPNLVFTVDDDLTGFLARPLASRNLLAIESDMITEISFRNENLNFKAQKQNGIWLSSDCALNSDAMERILIDFGAVKAIQSHAFSEDISNVSAEIRFSSKENESPAILKFGDIVPEQDGIVAARDGLDITFVLPARLVRDMASVCAAEPRQP
ncbi:MAG: DUF4340 domain-containing protein [Deltaproteobacteria bacterium]|nr:DUF4340 domain-containing protein [Deltaproteobacteria bacterium]